MSITKTAARKTAAIALVGAVVLGTSAAACDREDCDEALSGGQAVTLVAYTAAEDGTDVAAGKKPGRGFGSFGGCEDD